MFWPHNFPRLTLLHIILYFSQFGIILSCPNMCSGHGTCEVQKCICWSGFTGSDCSLRDCDRGVAWFDKATESTAAHAKSTVCSNAGLCNHASGKCECFPGFSGSSCQRASCPNNCSSHGQCLSIANISLFEGLDQNLDGSGIEYTNWEKETIRMCYCDLGFDGADCSLYMCPKGDNPKTPASGNSALSGFFQLKFMGRHHTFKANASSVSNDCLSDIVGEITNIDQTNSTFDAQGGTVYTLELRFTVTPTNNNIHKHSGRPPASKFLCYTDKAFGGNATCSIAVTNESSDIYEYETCGGNGICNFRTGECLCFDGYNGTACFNSVESIQWKENTPSLSLSSSFGGFTSNVLELSTDKASSDDFMFVNAKAGGETVFSIRGDGEFSTSSIDTEFLSTTHGLTVGTSTVGLLVRSTYNEGNEYNGLKVDMQGTSFSGNAVVINNDSSASATANALYITSNNVEKWRVRADGKMFCSTAEFSEGVTFVGAVSINGELTMSNTVAATDGSHQNDDQKFVMLAHKGTDTSFDQNVFITSTSNTCTNNSDGCAFKLFRAISGGSTTVFDIGGDGETTIHQGGISVISGGVNVSAGGLSVSSGGITVASGGLNVQGGGITSIGGATIDGGMNINNDTNASSSLTVTANGSNLSSVVDVLLVKAPNSLTGFDLIQAENSNGVVFRVKGDGATVVSSTTVNTSPETGALVVAGGLGVASNIYVGENLIVQGEIPSTSAVTGTFTIIGGAGIADDLYVGGIFHVEGEHDSSSSLTGSVTTSGGVGVSKDLYVGGLTHIVGNYPSSSPSTGALTVSGGVGIGQDLHVGATTTASSSLTGAVTIAGGIGIKKGMKVGGETPASSPLAGALTIAGGIGVAKQLYTGLGLHVQGTTQSTTPTSGTSTFAGGVGVAKNLNVGGNTSIIGSSPSTSSLNGTLRVVGGVGISEKLYAGESGVFQGTTESTSSESGTLLVNGGAGIAKSLYVGSSLNVAGNTTSESPITGVVTVMGGVGISENIYVGKIAKIGGDVTATSETSGALTVVGGLGVQQDVYIGSRLIVKSEMLSDSADSGSVTVVGGVGVSGDIYTGRTAHILGSIQSDSSLHGALTTAGGVGVKLHLFVGGEAHIQGTREATEYDAGTMTVTGGVGIAGDVYVGENIVVRGVTESDSTKSGSLVVAGGASIRKNMFVGGGMHIESDTLSTAPNNGAFTVAGGAGIAGDMNIGAQSSATSKTTGSLTTAGGAGIGKELYVGTELHVRSTRSSTSSVTGAVTISGGLGVAENIQSGGTTSSTSKVTGANVFAGGVGIGKELYVGEHVVFETTRDSSNFDNGGFVLNGGIGIGKQLNVGGVAKIGIGSGATVEATDHLTGALMVNGGVGISNKLYVGSTLTVVSTAQSTATNTGALTVTGGVGIKKKLWVGEGIEIASGAITAPSGQAWPDYVFEPEYPLMPLGIFEKFVLEKKHLPNITSSESLNNRIDIGSWIPQLLEKIEESSLYIIQLHKTILDMESKSRSVEKYLVDEKIKKQIQDRVASDLQSRVKSLEEEIKMIKKAIS